MLNFCCRSKSCKKDLWTQINTALQANNKWQRSVVGGQCSTSFHRVFQDQVEESDLQLPSEGYQISVPPSNVCPYPIFINTGLPATVAVVNSEQLDRNLNYAGQFSVQQEHNFEVRVTASINVDARIYSHINEQQHFEHNSWVQVAHILN